MFNQNRNYVRKKYVSIVIRYIIFLFVDIEAYVITPE